MFEHTNDKSLASGWQDIPTSELIKLLRELLTDDWRDVTYIMGDTEYGYSSQDKYIFDCLLGLEMGDCAFIQWITKYNTTITVRWIV